MTRRTWLASFQPSFARPVLETGVDASTKDKPQSKLWFAKGHWFAWLPQPGGSAVWRRETSGSWRRQNGLDLTGLPGQADVITLDQDRVAAVLIEPRRWSLVRLHGYSEGYRLSGQPATFPVVPSLETATVVSDGRQRLWVAYNSGRRMWVRCEEAGSWSEPLEITSQPAADDDICAITALPGGVGVLWSDQANDRVCFRTHLDRAPWDRWEPVEIVQAGGSNADDHLNIAHAGDGRLWVATKNSVDRQGSPQQVLRVRSSQGAWTNLPYARLTQRRAPTRPIAQLSADAARLHLLHTEGLSDRSVIVSRTFPVGRLQLDSPAEWSTLIDAGPGVAVNNVTGSKSRFPPGAPAIVLASDRQGRVYEGRL